MRSKMRVVKKDVFRIKPVNDQLKSEKKKLKMNLRKN